MDDKLGFYLLSTSGGIKIKIANLKIIFSSYV